MTEWTAKWFQIPDWAYSYYDDGIWDSNWPRWAYLYLRWRDRILTAPGRWKRKLFPGTLLQFGAWTKVAVDGDKREQALAIKKGMDLVYEGRVEPSIGRRGLLRRKYVLIGDARVIVKRISSPLHSPCWTVGLRWLIGRDGCEHDPMLTKDCLPDD